MLSIRKLMIQFIRIDRMIGEARGSSTVRVSGTGSASEMVCHCRLGTSAIQ